MSSVSIRVLGSGDAFGSGGRLQTCFHIAAGDFRFLIDCGATALIAMKRYGVDPGAVDAILLTHLHGDHFAGMPFLDREAQIAGQRTRPLIIAGPAGVEERLRQAMELLFPGSTQGAHTYPVEFAELMDGEDNHIGPLRVRSFPVVHTAGTNPHALRVEVAGKVVAYSGDTGWTPQLLEAASGADLFICECYTWESRKRNHLAYSTLLERYEQLGCKRIMLTHAGEDVLARRSELQFPLAEDGELIEL